MSNRRQPEARTRDLYLDPGKSQRIPLTVARERHRTINVARLRVTSRKASVDRTSNVMGVMRPAWEGTRDTTVL